MLEFKAGLVIFFAVIMAIIGLYTLVDAIIYLVKDEYNLYED